MSEPLLDDSTLADLADLAASARVGHTCTIRHRTPGTSGGAPTSGTLTNTTVACRFWAVTGAEASGDALAEMGHYRLEVAAAVAIDHTDTVTYLGKAYAVVWAPPPYEAGRIIGLETA